eukprot:TRINITY_DN16_c0_g1_i1.p3 TRINITY_DN16_c0_g1~~TRINITY_DN16_c0_g1_i1.p3  ORF type:complete len:264 (-),score=48.50 TRINITY_DN16_c0_g1_i1:177-968(-)
MGYVIQVQQTQVDKNRAAGIVAPTPVTSHREQTKLYIGNLPPSLNEKDFRPFVEDFGEVDYISIHADPDIRKPKSFAYVAYRRGDDARRASDGLNGASFQGRQVTIGWASDTKDKAPAQLNKLSGDLDEDEHMSVNAQSRSILSAKLQREDTLYAMTQSIQHDDVPPSPCLQLTNMFNPETEEDPHWDVDIQNDVKEECNKYGQVVHIFLDKYSPGHIWLKFSSISGAMACLKVMNGRFFAGRTITASFVPTSDYQRQFPEAR